MRINIQTSFYLNVYSRITMALALWLGCLALTLNVVYADTGCLSMATTDYELIYCEIIARGGGKRLPDFAQFQRNPPRTQALLLKRPAAKLGIVVDELKPVPTSASGELKRTQANQGSPRVTDQQLQREESFQKGELISKKAEGGELTQRCYLERKAIVCGELHYRLVENKHNRELASGVLNDTNNMKLPRYEGRSDDNDSLNIYLTDAYHQYINKMLEIGLGGVTMSYTRFYYTWQGLLEHEVDFVARLEDTYRYLKQDKRHLAIAAGVPPTFAGLESCMPLDEKLVVCDNSKNNWVFQLDGA